jgi:hypothetical protein
MDDEGKPKPSEAVLLSEYSGAQSSAEHHDNLVWTATGVLWAGSLVLFGLIVDGINGTGSKVLLTVVSLLGFLVNVGGWKICNGLRDLKRRKYDRCKEIEIMLGLKQHSNLSYSPCVQERMFDVGMVILVIAWVVLIIGVWCPLA